MPDHDRAYGTCKIEKMATEKQSASNDIERFARMHTDAQRRIFSFIRTLVHGWADAEEVLQEANMTIWQKRNEFDLDTNFIHWANQVAYFEVLKLRARNQKGPMLSTESLRHIATTMLDLDESLQHQSEILEGCLEKLSENDKKLIRRRYCDDIPAQSLAEVLGRSARSVHRSLLRIRNQLRRCIIHTLATEGQE